MLRIFSYILCFVFIFSCNDKSASKNKDATKGIPIISKIEIEPPYTFAEDQKWDSIRYFKDIIYTSNEGVYSLKKNELEYPFAVISYKKNSMRVSAFFNKSDYYHNYYTKENEMYKSTLDSVYKDDEDSYHYYIRYFSKRGEMYQIGYSLFDGIEITNISKIKSISTDTTKLVGYSFHVTNNITIKDALEFNEKILKKKSWGGGESISTIENYVEYSLFDSYEDYKDQKTKLRETKYNSYFFDDYYQTLQEEKEGRQ